MENTYIISDYSDKIKKFIEIAKIPESNIISYQTFLNESKYHDWTKEIFENKKINQLLIPISLSNDTNAIFNINGLKITLQIRLNYELSLEQRLIPIILLSDLSVENILKRNNFDIDNNPQYVLFTKGTYLCEFDAEELQNKLSTVQSCPTDNYQNEVLKKLKISRKAGEGKHSIANAWGCYKLAQASGYEKDIINKLENLKTIYAKYLICENDLKIKKGSKKESPNVIQCKEKKILFIDDQEDEGWTDILKHILKDAEITSTNSSKYRNSETKLFNDFNGFINDCKSHIGKAWDLIIIDLRLYPEKEDIDDTMTDPKSLSGYILIDEFLKINSGYQIIVFTASNKIWNINTALKRGAVAYYIKESPEFNYSKQDTEQLYAEFIRNVKVCLDRKYLFDLHNQIKELKINNCFQKEQREDMISFRNEVLGRNGTLEKISSLLQIDDKKDETLNLCLLLCFSILEKYVNLPSLGSFSYDNEGNNGSIFDREGKIKHIFDNYFREKKASSFFKIELGGYSFQKAGTKKTPISVTYYDNKEPRTLLEVDEKTGNRIEINRNSPSFIDKVISILKYRDNIDEKEIEEILKLRYYRSNVAAHNTGNVDLSKFKITKDHIIFFMNLFQKIFRSE